VGAEVGGTVVSGGTVVGGTVVGGTVVGGTVVCVGIVVGAEVPGALVEGSVVVPLLELEGPKFPASTTSSTSTATKMKISPIRYLFFIVCSSLHTFFLIIAFAWRKSNEEK
jgi:hypothetical protein